MGVYYHRRLLLWGGKFFFPRTRLSRYKKSLRGERIEIVGAVVRVRMVEIMVMVVIVGVVVGAVVVGIVSVVQD